ncbi:hypothetical protein Tco_1556034 [Tanacetum coccineum]
MQNFFKRNMLEEFKRNVQFPVKRNISSEICSSVSQAKYVEMCQAKHDTKSINKRALHKREYDNKVNERQMQTIEEKVDTSKPLDDRLVNTKSNGIESGKQDTSSNLGNDADIKPVYDEVPMAEVQLTAKINVLATGQ